MGATPLTTYDCEGSSNLLCKFRGAAEAKLHYGEPRLLHGVFEYTIYYYIMYRGEASVMQPVGSLVQG